jgi:serine/threonine protein kinase
MKTLYEVSMEYLQKNSDFTKKPSTRLDRELEIFCELVHNTLNGTLSIPVHSPSEERDPDFIAKYSSYNLSKCLGRGQAGIVFLAEDDEGTPLFAIKVIHLPGAVGVGLPLRKTFLAYQNVLKHLEHKYIIRYLGWTVVGNEAHVYTTYCQDGSLSRLIHSDKNNPGIKDMGIICKFISQILSGLMYLHGHGIVHR